MVMILGVIEIQHADTIHFFHLICQFLCLIKRHVTDQDPGGAIRGKFRIHQIQSPSGLCCVRQISGQIVINLDSVHG